MNRFHVWYCRSAGWQKRVEQSIMPWVLSGVDLGPATLELGPGLGVTTKLLIGRTENLTAVEVDPELVARLQRTLPEVAVMHGDATALSLPDNSFSAVVCFTMLHHLPSAQDQDRLFAEAYRVLRPGGVFVGSDSRVSLRFRLYHIADTMTLVDPDSMPDRLSEAGFVDVGTAAAPRTYKFFARKPV